MIQHKLYECLYNSRGGYRTAAASKTKKHLPLHTHTQCFVIVAHLDSLYLHFCMALRKTLDFAFFNFDLFSV